PADAGGVVRAGAGVAGVRCRVLPDGASVHAGGVVGRAGVGGSTEGAGVSATVAGGVPVDPRRGRLGRAGGAGAGAGAALAAQAAAPAARVPRGVRNPQIG